jgi:hypothetical protein
MFYVQISKKKSAIFGFEKSGRFKNGRINPPYKSAKIITISPLPLKVRWTKSFSVHMNVRSNHFVKWIFQKMVKFSYAFFPQKLTNFSICFLLAGNCHNYQICSLLGKKRIANFNHFLNNPLCEVIWPKVHVNRKRFRSMNFEKPEES